MFFSVVKSCAGHFFSMITAAVIPGILILAGLTGCEQRAALEKTSVYSWRSMLQGMELEGWTVTGSGTWKAARQGRLVGEGDGWIFTDKAYMNFNLRFVYQLAEGATASVAVRTSSGEVPVSNRGYEILLGQRVDDWQGAGSVVGIQPSRFRSAEESSGYHSCQISASGDRISVYIDGRKKADIHDLTSLKGMIGFKTPTGGNIQIFDFELQSLPDSELPSFPLEEVMNDVPGEFVSIMPGPKLEGWKMLWQDDGRWYYEGNVIIGTDVKNNSWLFTEKSYRDFILRLEFKWTEGSNGGVIYRYPWLPNTGTRPGGPQARAEETQIIFNDVEEPGALHGQMTVKRGVGRAEEWNKYELNCYDDRIAVYINGTKVTDWHCAVGREGAIGIQSLGAGSTMRYRNIEIKEMPRDFIYSE